MRSCAGAPLSSLCTAQGRVHTHSTRACPHWLEKASVLASLQTLWPQRRLLTPGLLSVFPVEEARERDERVLAAVPPQEGGWGRARSGGLGCAPLWTPGAEPASVWRRTSHPGTRI